MDPVDEHIARARHQATKEQSWASKFPRGFSIAVVAACAVAALAQKPQPPAPPTPPPAASSPAPTLSTAEKTALQALEKQKQDAQQAFSQAQQAEGVIEREFTQAHPGHHINTLTFAVEADNAPPEKTKTPLSPPKLPTK